MNFDNGVLLDVLQGKKALNEEYKIDRTLLNDLLETYNLSCHKVLKNTNLYE